MRSFLSRHKFRIILFLLLVMAELLVNPIGDFPLNDDWAFGKSVRIWMEEGRFTIGNWGYMTLATHLLWGILFTKVFGFSFTILRLSTLVSSLIGVLTLNRLIERLSNNQTLAFVASLTLLFNPVYFNLSNTYMTDVNFNTLLIVSVYLAYLYFQSNSKWYLLLLFFCSVALVLLRQFGLVFPIAFVISALFTQRRWLNIGLFSGVLILVLLCFKAYESYLKGIIPPDAGYKFSSGLGLTFKQSFDLFCYHFGLRYQSFFLFVMVMVSPLCVSLLMDSVTHTGRWKTLLIALLSCYLTYHLLSGHRFFIGNVFESTMLGPETFYESYFSKIRHNASEGFQWLAQMAIPVLCSISLFVVLVSIRFGFLTRGIRLSTNAPVFVLVFTLLTGYAGMLLLVPTYFDRYLLPMISFVLIVLLVKEKASSTYQRVGGLVLFFWMFISIAGTHDYLQWNRLRWQAYTDIKSEGIQPNKINGGFEVNCWDEGRESWWTNYTELNDYDYLIQFGPHQKLIPKKKSMFNRWLPWRQDSICSYRLNKNSIH